MVIAAGIDAGTETYQVYAIENGRECFSQTMETSRVKKDPELIFDALEKSGAEAIAGLSGYGLPVKSFTDLTDEDIAFMTLSREKEASVGLRSLIEVARSKGINIKTIPGVIHLPTVPEVRKINKIDMGTPDKVCSAALALEQLGEEAEYGEQNFILVEAGSGFNAFIAVEEGKMVDGIGGTLGPLAYRSMGCLDGELAYLLSPFPKSMVFNGGLKNYFGMTEAPEELPEDAMEWLAELIFKGIRAVETAIGNRDPLKIITSGRFFSIPQFRKVFQEAGEDYHYRIMGLEEDKQSAKGAAIIADGLARGQFEELVEHLELKNAGGTVLDYIAPEVKKYLDFP
ncbi:MAG: DUF1464 family protein [Archaeoglobaceae archaeon]